MWFKILTNFSHFEGVKFSDVSNYTLFLALTSKCFQTSVRETIALSLCNFGMKSMLGIRPVSVTVGCLFLWLESHKTLTVQFLVGFDLLQSHLK